MQQNSVWSEKGNLLSFVLFDDADPPEGLKRGLSVNWKIQTKPSFQAAPSPHPRTWDTFFWGCPLSSQEKALPDKIVLTVRTALHGITDLNGFISYLEGNPSCHTLEKSLLHNVHQKTSRENELKLSTRKRTLYLPAPYQGGHRPRKTPINHCSLPGQFTSFWPFPSSREVPPPLTHVDLIISQKEENILIAMLYLSKPSENIRQSSLDDRWNSRSTDWSRAILSNLF